MYYVLTCVAGCALTLSVWIPWRARYALTCLRIAATVLVLVLTTLAIAVLHELRGLDAIAGITTEAFSRVTAP